MGLVWVTNLFVTTFIVLSAPNPLCSRNILTFFWNVFAMLLPLRTFQRNGLQLDKDLIFSELVQNVYVYRMAKSKKSWPFRFYAIKFLSWEKMHGLLRQLRKMELKLLNYDW